MSINIKMNKSTIVNLRTVYHCLTFQNKFPNPKKRREYHNNEFFSRCQKRHKFPGSIFNEKKVFVLLYFNGFILYLLKVLFSHSFVLFCPKQNREERTKEKKIYKKCGFLINNLPSTFFTPFSHR